MNFPTLVYRTPGSHHCAGGTYDYMAAASPDVLEQLLGGGWFSTLQEAINGEALPDEILDDEEGEDEESDPLAVVRAWLSSKLNSVGIEHDEEMGEDELLFLICHEFAKPADDAPPPIDPPEPEIDDAPPTREELEAKATELEIKFDGRTTDKILAEKIEFVLSEQEQ